MMMMLLSRWPSKEQAGGRTDVTRRIIILVDSVRACKRLMSLRTKPGQGWNAEERKGMAIWAHACSNVTRADSPFLIIGMLCGGSVVVLLLSTAAAEIKGAQN